MPHTADVIVEAWGPDVVACAEEAAAGLMSVYAVPGPAAVVGHHRARLVATAPEALVLGVADEVIFALDTADGVPVRVEVVPAGDGYDVDVLLADRASIEPAGSVPKAVSRSELEVRAVRPGLRCRFIVDV